MLSIILPCFNERENVERYPASLIPTLKALAVPFEIIAVDDGSSDGTREALEKLKAAGAPIEPVVHERNLGLGAALRSGFACARGEWIATLDADLTFAPSAIGDLLRRQRETGADLVSGSPFLTPDGLAGVPWPRRLPSFMVNAFYRGLLRHDFTSYTPILRLYRASKLKTLELRSTGFEINAELAALFMRAGWKTAETPAVLTVREAGTSKMSGLKELSRHARLAARLIVGARAQRR